MFVNRTTETLPLAVVNSNPEDNKLSKISHFCCEFFEKLCNPKCLSKIGLASGIVSGIVTVCVIVVGSAINENYDDLGYKLFAIAIGTMFLAVCCLGVVWLPCKDGKCESGPRNRYQDLI